MLESYSIYKVQGYYSHYILQASNALSKYIALLTWSLACYEGDKIDMFCGEISLIPEWYIDQCLQD